MTNGEVSLDGDEDSTIDTTGKTNMSKWDKVAYPMDKKFTGIEVDEELGNTEEHNTDHHIDEVKTAEISNKQMKVSLELLFEEVDDPNDVSENAEATNNSLTHQIS